MDSNGKVQTYLLVFMGDGDPDSDTVESVSQMLLPATCAEELPGTFQVSGDPSHIEQCIAQLADWRLAQEGEFKLL